MMINAAVENAFERIAQRAGDVERAFTPGAVPRFDDDGAQASSRISSDPLSVAPPDDAYFVTADERGRRAYTQDGSFSLRDGRLVGTHGEPILGFIRDGAPLSELHCDAVDVALGRVHGARVESDGTLVYDRAFVDPRTGLSDRQRVVVGRIALARFPAGSRLTNVAPERYLAPQGVTAHVGRPGDGAFAPVMPMRRENSRIDFDRSLDRLEEAYVAFDALQAAHKAQSASTKTAMDLLK